MSRRPKNYKTKQKDAVLAYLARHGDAYLTAAQVVAHFQAGADFISRPTVYRQLERLVEEHKATKYNFNGDAGACFRYAGEPEGERDSFRLRCETCERIIVLRCDEVENFSRHIYEDHAFEVNGSKIVFYGKCELCVQK